VKEKTTAGRRHDCIAACELLQRGVWVAFDGSQGERSFATWEEGRAAYVHHRHALNRQLNPGYRSAGWWTFDDGAAPWRADVLPWEHPDDQAVYVVPFDPALVERPLAPRSTEQRPERRLVPPPEFRHLAQLRFLAASGELRQDEAAAILASAARDRIGRVRPGLLADLLVLRRNQPDPHRNLIEATEQDVRLVLVGGRPVYGTPAFMRSSGAHEPEPIAVGGRRRSISLRDPGVPDADMTWRGVLAALEAVRRDPAGAHELVQVAAAAAGEEPLRLIPDDPGGEPPVLLTSADLGEVRIPRSTRSRTTTTSSRHCVPRRSSAGCWTTCRGTTGTGGEDDAQHPERQGDPPRIGRMVHRSLALHLRSLPGPGQHELRGDAGLQRRSPGSRGGVAAAPA
jgi:hypothetical protein